MSKRLTPEEKAEREIIAHHEAGHAVIARALGVPVECVTIDPFAGRGGGVWHQKTRPEIEILISMAGPLADAEFTGRRPFYAGDDEDRIALALPHLPEPREHYAAKAKALMSGNWGVIEAVAQELLIGPGRLCGEMLDTAIRHARLSRSDRKC